MRREDQDKINRFSRLHQREKALEDELKTKQVCTCRFHSTHHGQRLTLRPQKDKEDLEEVSTELELVDEEDKVPYVSWFFFFFFCSSITGVFVFG